MIDITRVLVRVAKLLLLIVGLILAGILVAASVIAVGEYGKTHWLPNGNWVEVGVFTITTFVGLVMGFRASWDRIRFWLLMLILLTLHIAAYAVLFNWQPQHWPVMFVAVVSVEEAYVLEFVLLKLGFLEVRRPRKRRSSISTRL